MRATLRLRARVLLLCVGLVAMAASAAPASADEPFDLMYPQLLESGGRLHAIGWSWDVIDQAERSDSAFPTIAIVDSGIDVDHDEFSDEGTIDPASADCASGRPLVAVAPGFTRINDTFGHGTIVAGIAAAPANGVGIVGVSPYSSILAVRITSNLGGLACALDYLARQMDAGAVGELVVNLSLGKSGSFSPAVRRGIAQLVRRGALIVAATGNQSRGPGRPIEFPARLPHVLAVGDSEGKEVLPGPQLDLLAPGGNGLAPLNTGSWSTRDDEWETSYAAAVVSGAAAALWGAHAAHDGMSAQQLAYLLRTTASGTRWSRTKGFGTIDLRKAFATRRIPKDDETEPNDTETEASAADSKPALSCARGCSVSGVLSATDDPVDLWRVRVPAGRKVCKSLFPRRGGITARYVDGPRGFGFVRLKTTRPLVSYTLGVRLC